jgi:hypothetical protein
VREAAAKEWVAAVTAEAVRAVELWVEDATEVGAAVAATMAANAVVAAQLAVTRAAGHWSTIARSLECIQVGRLQS